MWPFTSYPERSPADVDGQTYDYIIVGGQQTDSPILENHAETDLGQFQ